MGARSPVQRLLRGLSLRLTKALDDPSPLSLKIGGLLVAQSQQAFDESKLGEFVWPRRYPNQGEGDHFVNIAGIVSDFARGKEPPARRFQARPPLLDEGYLRRTIKDKSKSMRLLNTHTVEVGTTDPEASKHQWGGQSEQFITDGVRENLKAWLAGGPSWKRTRTRTHTVSVDLSEFAELLPGRQSSALRKFKRKTREMFEPDVLSVKRDRETGYIGTLTRRERYGETLGFLFRHRVLYTAVNQRPFLGISDDYKVKIIAEVEKYFGEKAKVSVT